ncbi:hypothetical protein VP1G_08267 [Cytospora mali]|uniref:Uncharacterized protein n=1 Tax=Cytospora mali TaxID=578113 RepID=A0A194VB05_CYTMA|nr:hypothetical protein VP1G_08267 [Valsa mali var. pyri (nom. inval.)]
MSSLRHYLLPATLYAAALAPVVNAGFGNSFYLGPWSGDAYIKKATYSLTSPSVITDYVTSDTSLWIAIWVGVQQSDEDVDNENLVQPLLNWCIDQEDCGFAVNSSTTLIDQKVWLNGKLVAQQSDSAGMTPGVIYSANECSDTNCGTLASFSWTNFTLVFSEAVTDLNSYMSYNGASSSGLTTSDGGITWSVDAIAMGKDTTWDS